MGEGGRHSPGARATVDGHPSVDGGGHTGGGSGDQTGSDGGDHTGVEGGHATGARGAVGGHTGVGGDHGSGVTEFTCGGFVVGLTSRHTMTDGLGAGQFRAGRPADGRPGGRPPR
ncbi:glycine-rich cell wall structural protein 1.8-like [Panicum virgatum]|uniref:glycine-rich cell wall structural protein 1.8-like n=1 Tax=Panicum virgatum TaxID=38727 RepID=UPI0019D51C13|nr:glycine-rich cell wall structural protein 1.8-like [Panicum virgatum]